MGTPRIEARENRSGLLGTGRILYTLITAFPNSRYVPSSHLRKGERSSSGKFSWVTHSLFDAMLNTNGKQLLRSTVDSRDLVYTNTDKVNIG